MNDWELKPRMNQSYEFILDEKFIASGDFMALYRLNGIDPLVMMGTGSRLGHTAMALWFEEDGIRELYVLESQDSPHWPVKRIQRNKYRNWLKLAR